MRWEGIGPALVLAAVVGSLVLWRISRPPPGVGDEEAPTLPERVPSCRDLRDPDPAARVQRCLAALHTSVISPEAREKIGEIESGKVLLGVRAPLEALEGQELVDLASNPEMLEALLGRDEKQAAAALREAGVRGLVLSVDLKGALDRDDRVLARLVYRDQLDRFQIRWITHDALIYTVRSSSMRVPLATGEALLQGLRSRLAGEPPVPQEWTPTTVRLLGSMRLQGNMLVLRHAVGDDLEAVLDDLADKMAREWERKVVPEGHGELPARLGDVRLEVQIVMERARVEPRSRQAIFDTWQMGVDGVMFQQREGIEDDKFTYMPGSELVTRSHASADQFLRFATEWGGWHDSRPWEKDPRTRLDLIRTMHFMEREPGGGGGAVRLTRGAPEIELASVTDRQVQKMLVDGAEWWLRNMFPDGKVNYKYWPVQNRSSDDYNEVRHILAARDLVDAYRYRRDGRYLAGARRAMDWLLRYQVHDTDPVYAGMPHPPPGTMLFRYPLDEAEAARSTDPINQKLGTVAVALLAWVGWAEATGSHEEDERIRKMGRFVLSMLDEDGRFRPYHVPPGHPYEQARNDIVPGEAALALGEVAEYLKEPQWLDFFGKYLAFYAPWFRERAVRIRPEGRRPHDTYANQDRLDLVQFGPWSVMAAKQYYAMTGNAEAAAFGLEVADWMIDHYQWRGKDSPWDDFVGGYYKLPNELPAMQTFCYSEGTAAAYQLATSFAPERADKFKLATEESIRFLQVMQFDELDSYYVALPDKVHGGIKYTMSESKVRIDYVGHGLSTLSQYLDARARDPRVSLDVVDPQEAARWPLHPRDRAAAPAGAPPPG